MGKKGAGVIAAEVVAGSSGQDLTRWLNALADENVATAAEAARVLDALVGQQPALLVPQIKRLVVAIEHARPRGAEASAAALQVLVGLAPAKVARHMDRLKACFESADEATRDGLVMTFDALCGASIAYHRRLIDVLERALHDAEPATLLRWSSRVLPTLKGEPHAQARAIVEGRLPGLPRPVGQKLASLLGVKLRPIQA